jgi:hypothetical protein
VRRVDPRSEQGSHGFSRHGSHDDLDLLGSCSAKDQAVVRGSGAG